MTGNGAVVLVVGTGAAALWWLGYPAAGGIAAAAAVLLAIGLVWRLGVPGCTVELTVAPSRVHRGGEVELSASARSRRRWDRGLVHVRAELLGITRELAVPIAGGPPATSRVRATHRGVYRVAPAGAERVGPLRLARRRLPGAAATALEVLPRLHPFAMPRGMDVDADGPAGALRGGQVFTSLREYVAGDDVRQVHWVASARTADQTLLVRQHVIARMSAFRVVLDTDLDTGLDASAEERFEDCVDIAYSLFTLLQVGPGRPATLSTVHGGVVAEGADTARVEALLLAVRPCDVHPAGTAAGCRLALERATERAWSRRPGVVTVVVSTAAPRRVPRSPAIHFRVGVPERVRRTGASVRLDVPDAAVASRLWAEVAVR
ncbi:DUF58 domain-containing protein [Phytohabitans houttuyneae]|uniref:DUF58 domain-containing protein n=1 Tax=Phytohabitans houttuyneae TaxID=1076126 RepID=A0A6V8KSG3_9ACTN|nr:DUF58 domain-containing protein [Phytohabitans houttuyneae]GFJ84727.1 hypothetical protein Phou_089070 [Phytohabitans houttuyneae]